MRRTSMKIELNDSLFKDLEALSMLNLEGKEREIIKEDIKNILKYMDLLDEINVDEEEEMFTPLSRDMLPREDEVKKSRNIDSIVKEFPEKKDDYLKIPAIYKNE
jgi:aspartyl-tRNA(Asn)/glutamyl-tRNA(Gln) amidotransferase subunit C